MGPGWRVLVPALALLSSELPIPGSSSQEGKWTFTKTQQFPCFCLSLVSYPMCPRTASSPVCGRAGWVLPEV